MSNYELYRRTSLGECLTDALDDLIKTSQITPQLAMRVLFQFDRSMSESLAARSRGRVIIKVCLNDIPVSLQGPLAHVQIV